jgi:hypothetical protein
MTLHLLHESIYQNEPFNSEYVVDNERESLIFAVGTEVFYLISKDFIDNFKSLA